MFNTIKYLFQSEMNSSNMINYRTKFYQNQFNYANNFYFKDLKSHFSCVNAIEFSNKQSNYLISAGDDKRVLLWNIENDILSSTSSLDRSTYKPVLMKAQHNSNIFTLAWDNENQRIFSGSNDHQVIVHDVQTREVCDVYLHDGAVLCVTVDPKQSQIFATACENGDISLYDLRLSNTEPIILTSSSSSSSSSTNSRSSFNSCSFSPIDSNLIAIGNETNGLSLIDIRMKNTLLRYKRDNSNLNTAKSNDYKQNLMSLAFNQNGRMIGALRPKQRPVVYELNDPNPKYLLDHQDYINSCTLKSFCFAGDQDQYFVTGSDDFNIYIWHLSSISSYDCSTSSNNESNSCSLITDVHLRLKGHRSIVNQCRYNRQYHLLATSGIEKLIKIWSPYKLPHVDGGGLMGTQNEYLPKRKLFRSNSQNGSRGSNSELDRFLGISRDREQYNDESIEEDPDIIAYFDIQLKKLRKYDVNKRKDSLTSTSTLSLSNEDSNQSDTNYESTTSEEEDDKMSFSDRSTSSYKKSRILIEQNSSSSNDDDNDDNDDYYNYSESNQSDDDENEYSMKQAKNSNLKKKLTQTLRNRLRNLRHRKSLKLTEQSDYRNVLDSLKVNEVIENDESNESSFYFDSNKKISNEINLSSIQIEITECSRSDLDSSHSAVISVDNKKELNSLELQIDHNLNTNKINNNLKELNNHKRKIQNDDDDNEDCSDENLNDIKKNENQMNQQDQVKFMNKLNQTNKKRNYRNKNNFD